MFQPRNFSDFTQLHEVDEGLERNNFNTWTYVKNKKQVERKKMFVLINHTNQYKSRDLVIALWDQHPAFEQKSWGNESSNHEEMQEQIMTLDV